MSDPAAPPESGPARVAALAANWAARAVLLAAVCYVPWVWGGVFPGERVIACGAVALAAALAAVGVLLDRRAGSVPAFGLCLLGLAAVGAVQLAGGTRADLGAMGETLGGAPPWWVPATVAGPLTRAATADGLAAAGAAILGAVLFGSLAARRAACWALAGLGAAVAFFGLAALVRPEASVFPAGGSFRSFGPFVNRNNAGALLNAAVAAALALAADPTLGAGPRGRGGGAENYGWRALAAALGVTAAAGVVASASRGGALALCVGAAAGLAAVRLPILWRLGGAAAGLAAAGLLVGWLDLLGRLTDRLTAPGPGLFDASNVGRLAHWADVLPAVADRPLWGFGLGTYALAHLPYEDRPGSTTHVHADGMPVEWLLETGAAGTAAVAAGVTIAAVAAWRRSRGRVPGRSGGRPPFGPLAAAGLAGVVLVASQGTAGAFDLGLTLPGVFLPVSLLLGMLCAARPAAADFAPRAREPIFAPAAPERRPAAKVPVRGSKVPVRGSKIPVRGAGKVPVRGAEPARPAARPRRVVPRPYAADPRDEPAFAPPAVPLWRRGLTAAACVGLAAGCGWGWAEQAGAAAVSDAVRAFPAPEDRGRWTTEQLATAPERLRAALDRRPDDPAGLVTLGRVHLLRYRTATADALRPAAPELSDAAVWRLTDPEGLHLAAENWRAAGRADRLAQLAADPRVAADLPAAVAAFDAAFAAAPWHPQLPRRRAELAFLNSPDPPGADPGGARAVRFGHALLHGRPEDQLALGRLAWSAGEEELAAACWRRALELAPTPAGVLPEIAARLRLEPAWPANLAALLPDDPAVLAAAATLSGPARADVGENADEPAVDLLARLLPTPDLAPPPAERERLAARALELLGEPGVPPGVRAAAYAALGRHERARAAFGALLIAEPDDPAARVRYAAWLLDRGELREAAALARDARALALAAGLSTRAADRLLALIARAASRR